MGGLVTHDNDQFSVFSFLWYVDDHCLSPYVDDLPQTQKPLANCYWHSMIIGSQCLFVRIISFLYQSLRIRTVVAGL